MGSEMCIRDSNHSIGLPAGLDLRGDTLRLGLLPPLRGGRLAWPAPRAWDNPNPALPPYDVKTPHTWSPAYGGCIGRRAYLQDGLCVYLCVWHRTTPQEASAMEFWPHRGASETPRSEEASIWINFNQKSGPALHRELLKKRIFEQILRNLGKSLFEQLST